LKVTVPPASALLKMNHVEVT